MVLVWARTHLRHNLWALSDVVRLQLVAVMLQATDTIQYIVLRVDSTSHVPLVGNNALRACIGVLVSDGPRRPLHLHLLWFAWRLSRLFQPHRIVVLLDGIIASWSNLHWRHIAILSCEFPLLVHKLLLSPLDHAFSLMVDSRGRAVVVVLVDLHRLITRLIVLWLARKVSAFSRVRHNFGDLAVFWYAIFSVHLAAADFAANAILATDVATT